MNRHHASVCSNASQVADLFEYLDHAQARNGSHLVASAAPASMFAAKDAGCGRLRLNLPAEGK